MKSLIKTAVFALVITAFAFASTTGMAAEPQKNCPVMGGEINKDLHADYNGKRVYFCCPACGPQFKKSPEKFVKKLEDQGVKLEVVN
ncbi:YHS domain-containing protein [Halodesulfovibrio aestuarii]|uniref:YHS domain-containing protein n=1 Tax=Halodesulfovibrio aestuarii TaxID=126333 RepID=A0A8G2C8M1_9BACT|nr:YHS domain-containing protein [Halodesulfovibrio aestuarii]SHI83602.1 YHS domain-containing protein [Halodesulfovibrio aestuarii]